MTDNVRLASLRLRRMIQLGPDGHDTSLHLVFDVLLERAERTGQQREFLISFMQSFRTQNWSHWPTFSEIARSVEREHSNRRKRGRPRKHPLKKETEDERSGTDPEIG